MTSRDIVLRRIRDALGPSPSVPDVPRDYATTGDLDHAATVERFAERVDDYRANVHRADPQALAADLARILSDAGATRVGVPAGLDRTWLDGVSSDIEVRRDGDGSDRPPMEVGDLDALDVVVTAAAVGIADTGTIVLDASVDQGRRALTLVPDHHICVITSDQIVQTVPEGLARIEPARALTMISGPSATSDIELDRVEGVHGPRTLDVIIISSLPSLSSM